MDFDDWGDMERGFDEADFHVKCLKETDADESCKVCGGRSSEWDQQTRDGVCAECIYGRHLKAKLVSTGDGGHEFETTSFNGKHNIVILQGEDCDPSLKLGAEGWLVFTFPREWFRFVREITR